MEFKFPQLKFFKKKEEVTDSSSSFEEKNQNLQEKMNRIYKYGGMSGMAIGVLS
ncbi:pilus assembly protein, partial [Escherichia coli]|nr:pilus assembly protein [Escherichia coli]